MSRLPPEDEVGRRQFLSFTITGAAGAVGTLVGSPAIGRLVSPGPKRQNQSQWGTLGPVTGLTPGKPAGSPFE